MQVAFPGADGDGDHTEDDGREEGVLITTDNLRRDREVRAAAEHV